MFDDELMEAVLMEETTEELIKRGIRKVHCPVSWWYSAVRHTRTWVFALLDGVIDYLPNPTEVENIGLDLDNERRVALSHDWISRW